MALLLAARHGEGGDGVAARLQGGGDALDGAALAGGVPALEDGEHGDPPLVHPEVQLAHAQLLGGDRALVVLAREAAAEVDGVELAHRDPPSSGIPASSATVRTRASSSALRRAR